MRRWQVAALALAAAAAGSLGWAQARKAGAEVEGQVRMAAFQYVLATMLGDVDGYLKAARPPLYVLRDGAGVLRDEKRSRAALEAIAAHNKDAKLTDDDRKQIAQNLLVLVDQASVQFVGADTAAIAVATHPAAKPDQGDSITELILHRKADRWQVIAEISDSKPVPPGYLKE